MLRPSAAVFPLALALLAAACGGGSSPSVPAAGTPAEPGATVTTRVVFEGSAPEAQVIRLDGDPKCVELQAGEPRLTQTIVLGDGHALQHVFVYVKDGVKRSYPVPTDPVVLDQQKCWYVPRVLGIRTGQPLAIRNSDPLLHNVRSDSQYNEPFNVGQPVKDMTITRVYATSEVMVPVKCDVHSWMRAYIGVLDHPFFGVTSQAGTVSLADLPPGTYTIEAWHEQLGTQTQQVTVASGEKKDVTFTFKL